MRQKTRTAPRTAQGFGRTSGSTNAPKISLCAIVKNEVDRIAASLASVAGFVDEIILVDTGSTDNTIDRAQQLGAKVFEFAWCDDFAAARNFSIQQAKGDWILVLDADEIFDQSIEPVLTKLIQQPNCLAINLTRLEVGAQQSPYSLVSRLFRRHKDIVFTGYYHESIDRSAIAIQQQQPQWQVVTVPTVAIHHYGYQASEIVAKNKQAFAKRLMLKHLEEYPHDIYMHSKLGALEVEHGELQSGLDLLHAGLKLAELDRSNSDRLTEFELYYHLAIGSSHMHDHQAAQTYYQKALMLDVPDIVKLPAYNNLGSILLDRGDITNSIAIYQKVIEIAPTFAKAHYNLGIALKVSGNLSQAAIEYNQAIYLAPDYAEAYQNLGVVLVHLGQTQQSIEAFQQSIELHERQQNHTAAQAIRAGLQSLGLVEVSEIDSN